MIYFIQCENSKYIKIGSSNKLDINHRIKALQTSCPEKLSLLKTIDGNYHLERVLHKRFISDKIRGEWFMASVRLLSFINNEKEGKSNHSKDQLHSTFSSVDYQLEDMSNRIARMRMRFGLKEIKND